MTTKSTAEPEFAAIATVHEALSPLDAEAQVRVLKYVAAKLKIQLASSQSASREDAQAPKDSVDEHNHTPEHTPSGTDEAAPDDLEGISPAGKKWMARNGLHAAQLSSIFSLGIDEIDLVAEKVPGAGKRERMRSVYLLKGVAAYLGSGVASFTQAQVKEALLHYDAFDVKNNATYFASLSAEVSGTKDTGYALTPRGLSNATTLLKSMTKAPTPA